MIRSIGRPLAPTTICTRYRQVSALIKGYWSRLEII
jgi:hypothetical protein